jgi:ribosomal protein S15
MLALAAAAFGRPTTGGSAAPAAAVACRLLLQQQQQPMLFSVAAPSPRLLLPHAIISDLHARHLSHSQASSSGGEGGGSGAAAAPPSSSPPSPLPPQPELVDRYLSADLMSKRQRLALRKADTVARFQRFDGDVGSTEVQVALLTERIRDMAEHVTAHKKDFHNARCVTFFCWPAVLLGVAGGGACDREPKANNPQQPPHNTKKNQRPGRAAQPAPQAAILPAPRRL